MVEIVTSVDIDAPPERVWAPLSDFASYPSWNPMVERATGTSAEGDSAVLRYRSSVGILLRFRVRITRSEPDRELRWIGVSLGVTGDHYFRIESRGTDACRLVHGEIFSGGPASLLAPVFRRQVPVFERFNRALKAEAERPA